MYELSIKETEVVAGGEVVAAAAVIVLGAAAIAWLSGPTYYDVREPIYDKYGYPTGDDLVTTYQRAGWLWG